MWLFCIFAILTGFAFSMELISSFCRLAMLSLLTTKLLQSSLSPITLKGVAFSRAVRSYCAGPSQCHYLRILQTPSGVKLCRKHKNTDQCRRYCTQVAYLRHAKILSFSFYKTFTPPEYPISLITLGLSRRAGIPMSLS